MPWTSHDTIIQVPCIDKVLELEQALLLNQDVLNKKRADGVHLTLIITHLDQSNIIVLVWHIIILEVNLKLSLG